MKKSLLLLLFLLPSLITAQASKDSLLARDADMLIEELRFLHDLDQGIREYLNYGTFDKSVTDSIEALSKEEIQLAQESLRLSQSTRDKVWDMYLTPIDFANADLMVEIIEQYGFPSQERLEKFSGQDIDFSPRTILVHTPFSYKDKMIPLLEREYKAGNLGSRCDYGYLLWHLNGRTDFKYMLDNGYEMRTKDDGTFELIHTCK